jgi:hypothetical protein
MALWRCLTSPVHPKAKRLCGWHDINGKEDHGERFVTVPELPPVMSAQTAVKVAVAGEIRQKRKQNEK